MVKSIRIAKSIFLTTFIFIFALLCVTFTSADNSGTVINGSQTYTWAFESETQTLTLEVTDGRAYGEEITRKVSQDSDYIAFANSYGQDVKTIKVINVTKVRGAFSLLCCPNTETIIFENCSNRWDDTPGIFADLPSLKTLKLSGSADSVDYIDLTKIGSIGNSNGQNTQNMFMNCTSIEKVVLPDKAFEGVTSGMPYILNGMFDGCTSLSDIVLPSWVTEIKANAFRNCTSLKTINIPDSVTSIANGAFAGAGIESVIFSGTDCSVITSAFDKSVVIYTENADVKAKLSSAGYTAKSRFDDLNLGGTVINGTQTYTWNFSGASRMLTLEVTEGRAWGEEITRKVSQDSDYIAFANSYGQEVKTIKVINVGKLRGAFSLLCCPNTETIIFENCDNRWDDTPGIFAGLPNLKTLKLKGSADSVDYIDLTKIGIIGNSNGQNTQNMFMNCTSIEKVVLPDKTFEGVSGSMPYILNGMFDGCTSLSDIVLPS